MKKLISHNRERTWYLMKEWTAAAGLKAMVFQCCWNQNVKKIASSLHDHFTGYVQVPEGDKTDYYQAPDIEVHGGVTFFGTRDGAEGMWAGFDMAHLGDENLQDLGYATEQCEKLAEQIKSKQN